MMFSKINWKLPIDWTRTNWELAMSLGCTRARVRQKRKELGIAPSTREEKRWKFIKSTFNKPDSWDKLAL